MQREKIYGALFERLSDLKSLVEVERGAIPAEPYKIYTLWASRFDYNISVMTSNNVTLTEIFSGVPNQGEYLVNEGVYTFSSQDEGVNVVISYLYKGIVSAYMSLTHWDDVSPDEMPAVFLVPKTEENIPKRGLPPKWQIDLDVYLYVNAPQNPTVSPSTLINPLLDEIETMLSIDDYAANVCTLDGLVSHAWISGQILRGEGRISSSEIAIIPINILVPN